MLPTPWSSEGFLHNLQITNYVFALISGGYRVHVTDPDVAKHVLVSNCKNYRRQDVLKKMLPGFGNGLITSNGRAHAMQRKQLNPFFSIGRIRNFLPLFIDKTNHLIQVRSSTFTYWGLFFLNLLYFTEVISL